MFFKSIIRHMVLVINHCQRIWFCLEPVHSEFTGLDCYKVRASDCLHVLLLKVEDCLNGCGCFRTCLIYVLICHKRICILFCKHKLSLFRKFWFKFIAYSEVVADLNVDSDNIYQILTNCLSNIPEFAYMACNRFSIQF